MIIFQRLFFVVFCLAFLFVYTSCEDMFMKTIDIDVAEVQAKLTVTATLDADSGRFGGKGDACR